MEALIGLYVCGPTLLYRAQEDRELAGMKLTT